MEITPIFIEYIKNGTPFSFSKFGDGEYMCASYFEGANCDGDTYTESLRRDLVISFQKTVEQGGFIGLWWHDYVKKFWESKVENPNIIKWVNYHAVIIDKEVDSKIELYKTIKESPIHKIYIHNYLLKRVKTLLNVDIEVIIDIRNWYSKKDEIKQEIINKMKDKNIIMTSMGMGAKVIIQQLHSLFPYNIFIDIGSALDLICTKRDSRGNSKYEKHKELFKDILPENWENEKEGYIFEEARRKLGIHL